MFTCKNYGIVRHHLSLADKDVQPQFWTQIKVHAPHKKKEEEEEEEDEDEEEETA